MILQIPTVDDLSIFESILKGRSDLAYIITLVVISVLILVRVYFKYRKDKKVNDKFNSIMTVLSMQSDMFKEIMLMQRVVNQGYVDDITPSQAEMLITKVYDVSFLWIYVYIQDVIKTNNIIRDQESIKANMVKYIESLWESDRLYLSRWKCKGIEINTVLNRTSIVFISDMIMDDLKKKTPKDDMFLKLKTQFNTYKNNAKGALSL